MFSEYFDAHFYYLASPLMKSCSNIIPNKALSVLFVCTIIGVIGMHSF